MKKIWGIKQRVLFLALVPTIVISILLGVYFASLRIDDLFQALNARGSAKASRLASQGKNGLFAGDVIALKDLAEHEKSLETSSISFYNKDRIKIAGIGDCNENLLPNFEVNNNIHIYTNKHKDTTVFISSINLPDLVMVEENQDFTNLKDVKLQSDIIGWVKVEMDRKPTRIKEIQVLTHSGMLVIFGLCISGLLALRLGHQVIQPILSLTKAVELIRQGKLSTRANTGAEWELGILESGINSMVTSLQAAHNEMQNSIAQATADLRKTLETIEIQNIELKNSRKEAESASRSKSEFLANMSHELRTPLNGIIGFTNLIKKTHLSEKQHDFLNTIQKSANNLLSIINEVLDFSKIEAGKLQLHNEPIDIRECLDDALTLLAPSAHDKNIEIIPFVYSDVPVKIQSDPLRIRQVITNLVNNAIKFTEKGNVVIRAMLDNIDKNSNKVSISISVADTGIGLTEKQKKELFNAFTQVNPSISKKFGGTGLGLVICKKIVEAMGGEIHLESVASKGSTFWFTIIADLIKESNLTQDILKPNHLEGIKVILFEKHPIAKLSITHLMESWGMTVKNVESSSQLLEYIQSEHTNGSPYQIAIIGVNQPGREQKFIDNITIDMISQKYSCPVGILANTTDITIHNEILKSGATLCLAKPLSRNKFYYALSDLFSGRLKLTPLPKETIVDDEIKILAVDDNLANLKLLCAILENSGVNVTTATNGFLAIKLIKNQQFDLILMDIHMPAMDGIQTSKEIRKQKNNPNSQVPIIAISAHMSYYDKQHLLEQQVINDYFIKPINENQIQACIYKWIYSGFSHKQLTDITISKEEYTTMVHSINWRESIKLAAGKIDLAKDLLEMLIDALPREINEIKNCLKNQEFNEIADKLHKLHGSCCYTSVPNLKNIIKEFENKIRSGNHDVQMNLNIMSQEVSNIIAHYHSDSFKMLVETKNVAIAN